MQPELDLEPDTVSASASRKRATRVSRFPDLPDLPDLYERKRRLPPMFIAGIAFAAAATAFYGAEAALPAQWKPSYYIGGYTQEIEAARKTGELEATAKFAPRLKRIETAAVMMQEQCKAQLQSVNTYAQAVYNRAGIGFQLAADLQRQYASARYSVVQQSLGGELGAANMATSFGYIASLFDPDLAQKSMDFAQNARQQALAKLDEAAQGGVSVSAQGWDQGLTDPATFAKSLHCDLPSDLAEAQPSSEG